MHERKKEKKRKKGKKKEADTKKGNEISAATRLI